MPVYLDNAATTRVCPEAAQAAMDAMLEHYGNPSSQHRLGRDAKKLLDGSRESVAAALGCKPEELYFTSCGTESDSWAIRCGAMYARRVGKHIISSMAEHDAIRQALTLMEDQGFEVTRLKPEKDGSISISSVMDALREDTCLVSLMMVNNETGGVTDIAGIAKAMRDRGSRALLHTDAVQGFLKLPFSASALGADMISISGHKIHAPKGIGALYIRSGLNLQPLLPGGGQESGKRSGTEALPAIAAFGAASRIGAEAMDEALPRMSAIKRYITDRVMSECDGAAVVESAAPHIICLSLPGNRSETILNLLDSRDICVSRGSACKKGRRSHVLESIGMKPAVIDGAIRISLSRYTTMSDAEAVCDALRDARKGLFRGR